ncbi:MAG: EamA family transporter, partial [Caldilineae bacterium]
MTGEERRGLLFVACAVLLFSTSPVLVRWAARSLTAYEIAAGRLLVAGALVLGLALLRRERLPGRAEWGRFFFYGLVTALHFGLYIASLAYTTIAHSLALVYTAPIFVALFSRIYLKESLTARKWFGVAIAVCGVAVLAGFEPQFTRRMVFGDLL